MAFEDSRLGRVVGRLSLPLALLCLLLLKSGVRLSWLPEPVTIVEGNQTDVYTWEMLLAW